MPYRLAKHQHAEPHGQGRSHTQPRGATAGIWSATVPEGRLGEPASRKEEAPTAASADAAPAAQREGTGHGLPGTPTAHRQEGHPDGPPARQAETCKASEAEMTNEGLGSGLGSLASSPVRVTRAREDGWGTIAPVSPHPNCNQDMQWKK